MRNFDVLSFGVVVLIAAVLSSPCAAQQPAGLAPPKPYKPVALTLPQPAKDTGLEAFRSRLSELAKKAAGSVNSPRRRTAPRSPKQ
jgi:hypothetical protein